MPNFNDQTEAAKFLADIDFDIRDTSQRTFSPDHMAYHCALSKGSDTFYTIYQSNPQFNDKPTVTDVIGSLSSEAKLAREAERCGQGVPWGIRGAGR